MALRGHQASQERDFPRRRRAPQPARRGKRHAAAERDPRLAQDALLPERHARAQAWPQRQAPLRGDWQEDGRTRPLKGQGRRDGGHQVPPVRAARALRERPDHLVHPARRRVRAHVLSPEHAGEAAHLDRGGRRAALAQPHRVHDQGQVAVQAALHRQQRRDRGARAAGRRLANLQDVDRHCEVRPRARRRRLEHKAVPRWEGVPDARPLRPAEREQRGGQEGQAAHHGQV
mmetsp:Transcript_42645/g.93431  ORF Transcript_42645/g.93431 Transcript_42645/m.93431 type:complete len:231 (+) Transcript_42645:524-1216(+)